jgi:integrase
MIFQFLENLTRNQAKSTRRLRYAQIKAFYNFIIEKCAINMRNPCNGSLFSKAFRVPKQVSRNILDKESVDELIYNTRNQRDRLIMELQARCGLRIGELLKMKVSDISERKARLPSYRNRLQSGSMNTSNRKTCLLTRGSFRFRIQQQGQ